MGERAGTVEEKAAKKAAYNRRYYLRTREQRLARKREAPVEWKRGNAEYLRRWRKDNPEKHRATTRRQTLKMHGLTVEDYNQMFVAQGEVCAACGCGEPRQGKWHVDHCHETGTVRGILCQGCNHVLGHADDSVDILLDVANYLKKAPPDIRRQIEDQAGLEPSTDESGKTVEHPNTPEPASEGAE